MNYGECLQMIAKEWSDELVVTSAGTSSEIWFEATGETERVFYLEASMSMSSMFAAGIAFGVPDHQVWAFSGDGAFAMNDWSFGQLCRLAGVAKETVNRLSPDTA